MIKIRTLLEIVHYISGRRTDRVRAHQNKEHPNIEGLTIIKVPQEGAEVDNMTGEILQQPATANQQLGISGLQGSPGIANQKPGNSTIAAIASQAISNSLTSIAADNLHRQRLKEIQTMKHQMWSKLGSVGKKDALPTMVPLPTVGGVKLSPRSNTLPDSLTVTMSSVFPEQENMEKSQTKPQTYGADRQVPPKQESIGQPKWDQRHLNAPQSNELKSQMQTKSEQAGSEATLNTAMSDTSDTIDSELGVISSVDIIKQESQATAKTAQAATPSAIRNMLETATPTSTAIKPISRRKAQPIKREVDCNDLSSSSCETSPEVKYPKSEPFPTKSTTAADSGSSPYFNNVSTIERSNMSLADTGFPTTSYLATHGAGSVSMRPALPAMTMQQSGHTNIKQESMTSCYPPEHHGLSLPHTQPTLPPPVTPSNMWRQDNMFGVTYPSNILNQQGSSMPSQKPSPVALYSNYYQ